MTIHAAGYDRQSAERASGSVSSPAAQRAANKGEADRRAAQGADLVWVGHFSEAPGTSAFTGKERPKFNALLDACRMGQVNMIIVHYISRLSRQEPLDIIPIVTEILNLGVTIVSVNEGEFRKGNLMDLLHLIMRLDAAHSESRNKAVAVKTAHDQARALGGYVGKAPYGFEMVSETRLNGEGKPILVQLLRHKTTPLPKKNALGLTNEPDIVRWVWRTIKTHMNTPAKGGRGNYHPGSITGICKAMEAAQVMTKGATIGKKVADSVWDPVTLKRILRDPRIAGFDCTPVYSVRSDGKLGRSARSYRIRRDPVTMRPVTLDCGPIIDPAEWHELQLWLDGRGRGKGQSRGQALLSAMEMLYCECGAVMVGHAKNAQPEKSSYECKRKRRKEGQHEGSVTIVQNDLNDHVAGSVFARLRHAEDDEDTMILLMEAARRFGTITESAERAGERAELTAERADAARALEELYDDRAAGGYGGPIGRRKFLEQEGVLTLRMQGAEERISELNAAANPVLPIHEWLPEDPSEDPIGPGSWWHKSAVEDRRAFLRLFIDKVVVSKAPPGGRWAADTRDRTVIHWAQCPEEENDAQTAA